MWLWFASALLAAIAAGFVALALANSAGSLKRAIIYRAIGLGLVFGAYLVFVVTLSPAWWTGH